MAGKIKSAYELALEKLGEKGDPSGNFEPGKEGADRGSPEAVQGQTG